MKISEGRVMEVLSEHLCQGWLEGLLTGRHGFFSCYEALFPSLIRCSTCTPNGSKQAVLFLGGDLFFAQLSALVKRLVIGSQQFFASGSRFY